MNAAETVPPGLPSGPYVARSAARPAPQWSFDLIINAPVDVVWDIMDDLTLIPRYHPHVRHVEYLSGATRRAAGVSYKCVIPDGRRAGWCVEEIIEYVPGERMTVAFPEDSWGFGRIVSDFTTELAVQPGPWLGSSDGNTGGETTTLHIRASYRLKGLPRRVFNAIILRRMMRRRVGQCSATSSALSRQTAAATMELALDCQKSRRLFRLA